MLFLIESYYFPILKATLKMVLLAKNLLSWESEFLNLARLG
jgi:hypothetical protein